MCPCAHPCLPLPPWEAFHSVHSVTVQPNFFGAPKEDRLPTFSKQVVAWSTKQKGYLIYAAANQITKVEKHQKKAWVLPLLIPCVFAPFRGSCSSFLFFFLLPCPLSLSPFLLRCIPCSAPLPSASSFATSMPLAIPFPLFSNPL